MVLGFGFWVLGFGFWGPGFAGGVLFFVSAGAGGAVMKSDSDISTLFADEAVNIFCSALCRKSHNSDSIARWSSMDKIRAIDFRLFIRLQSIPLF